MSTSASSDISSRSLTRATVIGPALASASAIVGVVGTEWSEPGIGLPWGHVALLFEGEDRLQVLLGRIVQLGPEPTLRPSRPRRSPGSRACTRAGRVPTWVSTRLS